MFYILVGIIIILVFLFSLFAYIGYRVVTPDRLVGQWSPRDFGAKYKDIELRTEDGLTLKGWHILGGERCVVLLHGYTRSRWDDVYMRWIMEELWRNGYSVLAVDFRAHGESQGKHTTLGDKERMDVKAMLDYARKECKKVYILGYSMGGFLAIAFASLGMVDGAVADSPYIYPDKTGARGLKYFTNLPEGFYKVVKPFAILISGARMKNANPFNYLDIKAPLLIIAGRKDPIVKVEEVQEFVKKAKGPVELWVTDGEHVRSIRIDMKEYVDRILKFFSQ